jgi:hypothetical protein
MQDEFGLRSGGNEAPPKGLDMRVVIRSLGASFLALLSAIALVVSWTATTALQLAATALIMGGTGHPLSTPPEDPVGYVNPYMDNAIDGFINLAAAVPTGTGNAPIGMVSADDDRYAIITPEQFFPVSGLTTFDESVDMGLANLDSCLRGTGCQYSDNGLLDPEAPEDAPITGDEFDIFGYSQSAVIASLEKQAAIDEPGDTPLDLHFFLLANPMRPNGGFLSRGPEGLTIPIIGITFHGATPTNSCEVGECFETVDVAVQYDGLGGDAALGLTNVLAVANAVMGYLLLHGELQNSNFDNALYQGSFGDTDYYLIPTPRLPLLMPFEPIVPSPILTLLDGPLRAVIEAGYARDVNPGVATPVSIFPFRDPVKAILNILTSIPTAIDDALAEANNDPSFRPLGTAPVTSPFGVGGPELPDPPSDIDLSALARSDKHGDDEKVESDESLIHSLSADEPDADEPDADEPDADEPDADEPDVGASAVADDDENAIEDAREDEAVDTDATAGATPETTPATTPGTNTPASTQQPQTPTTTGPQAAEDTGSQPDSDPDDAGKAAA